MIAGSEGSSAELLSACAFPKPGDVIGAKYRIEEVAAEGGMGAIFVAQHLVLDQRVAVKVLLAQAARDTDTVERFMREAQAAARLNSEHVARVIDAGVLDSGLPFLVMEYLDGCDLTELLALQGPLAPQEVADFALQALEGLGHAHALGIIHRDLKPSNLFLAVRADGSNVLKVLDFGISKSTSDATGAPVKTLTGKAVLGSPAYMSPEQVRNARMVDARSDLWSLGVSMYELLTGRIPFDGDGVGEMLAAILEADPPSVLDLRPDLSKPMAAVVHRCLERKRDDRYADAGELARALAPFGSGRWDALPDQIAATLANAAQLRMPTPLGSFPMLPVAIKSDPDGATAPVASPSGARVGPISGKIPLARAERAQRALRADRDAPRATPAERSAARRGRGAWVIAAACLAVISIATIVVLSRTERGPGTTEAPANRVDKGAPVVAAARTWTDGTITAVDVAPSSSSASPAAIAPPTPRRSGAAPPASQGRPSILKSRD